nr:peptide ABC transporter substrate-binding protein [Sulfobacillus harzensis]
MVQDQSFKPLIWLNTHWQIVWKSSIAKKITYNAQGTVYHVFLNKKWHWSNGQPVTAKDLMFTWNVIKAASAANAPQPWPYVGVGTGDIPSGIQSVVENNNYEVTFTLKQPANQQWFIYNGLVQFFPLPAQTMDVDGNNWSKEIAYLGSLGTNPAAMEKVVDGPFILQKAVKNQYWVMVPNPHYDGHKANVSKLVFDYEGSNDSEYAALKTGQINVGYLDLSQYGARGALVAQGDKIVPAYLMSDYWTDLNMRPGSTTRAIFDQLPVRQALEMGIDQQAINKKIYHGFAPPTYGPIPSTPRTKFFDPALKSNPYPYNPKAGKALLEQNGWKDVNGVMTKGNEKLQFTMLYTTGTESTTQTVELMQQDWAKEGIQVTLKGVSFPEMISMEFNTSQPKTWQMATGSGWAYDGPGWYPSGDGLFNTGAPNGDGYSSSEEDALINATHQPQATQAKTMQIFFKYEDYTAKQVPMLWENNFGGLDVFAPTVHNTSYINGATGLSQFNYFWISK